MSSDLDHQRWLINNGLFTPTAKNNLYAYGSLIHTDVQAVDLSIDIINKTFTYTVYIPKYLLKAKTNIDYLRSKKTLWSLWKLRSLVRKYGNLDFYPILLNFIHDYCGPAWKVNLIVDNINNYKEPQKTDLDDGPGGITKDTEFNR